MKGALNVNPVLLAVTLSAIAGFAWVLFEEWRDSRPTPPPADDGWDWEWDGEE